MLQNKLRKMLLMLCLALASCISAPPDFMGCANLGDEGYCKTYVSKKISTYDNKFRFYKSSSGKSLKWSEVIATSVLVPADQFVKVKTFFDNYCHENGCPDGLGDWNGFATDLGNHIRRGND